jgi:SAM-dependent methyltransferase
MIGWINKLIYRSSKFSKSYDSDYLWPAEKILFEEIPKHSRIADLGVGAGRTTKYLLSKASYYKCFDVSEKYINNLKSKYVGVNAVVQDFKSKTFFSENEEYDAVVISFNSLDYVEHRSRISLLEQISKVLSVGGVLIFSTHNYYYKIPKKSYSYLILTYRAVVKMLISSKKTNECEIKYVQDSGLKGTLITYYISVESQLGQIQNIFGSDVKIKVYNKDGIKLSLNDYSKQDESEPWYYYKIEKK